MGTELREALDEAWEDNGDEGETLAPASEVIEPEGEPSDDQELGDSQQADGAGGSAEDYGADRQYAPGDERGQSTSDATGDNAGDGSSVQADGGEGSAQGEAPIGWTPEAREGWGDIPDATKAQILQRERDIEQNMANTNTARQESQVFNQIASKFAPVMAAEGINNPFQAIEGMFQTAAELRMGNPQQKARRIAQMINNYGVDIETLDALLVGEAPADNQNQQMAQLIDQRMQPVNQMMNQLAGMQQNKVQEQHNDANQQVGNFAQNAEFINDVRYDMADLMDMAAKRGQNLSLEEAYEKACAVHPQVSQVLHKRAEQESLLNKQKASMSINGSGHEASPSTANNSLGDDVRAAWDAFS